MYLYLAVRQRSKINRITNQPGFIYLFEAACAVFRENVESNLFLINNNSIESDAYAKCTNVFTGEGPAG